MTPERITRVKLKVVVVGDRAVGKTSLLNRYVFNYFRSEYQGTLGSTLRYVNVQEPAGADHLVEAQVAFFDLMGERGMRDAFKDVFYWGTHGFLAVADVSRPPTIRSLLGWIRAVRDVAGEVPYAILMNKADLADGAPISPEDTAWLLDELPGVPYHLTSAKTGAGVERAFETVLDAMVSVSLDQAKVHRRSRIVGDRILALAKRRPILGVGKKEILLAFKDVESQIVLREVDDLKALGLVSVDVISATSFRLRITPKGLQEVERLLAPERIFEASE